MRIVKRTENGIKIDLIALIHFLMQKLWILILVTALGGAGTYFFVHTLVKPKYTANITLYVNNSTNDVRASYITSGDISASAAIANTYTSIIKSNQLLSQVISETGVDASLDSIRSCVDVSAKDGNQILTVSVTRVEPKEAAFIANTIGSLVPGLLTQIVEGSSVKVIDTALIPTKISSPNYKGTAVLGAMTSCIICLVLIILLESLRTGISSEEDLEEWDIPMLAVIDNFEKKSKKRGKHTVTTPAILEENTPFYIREAYNLARTNLILSIAGKGCKKILFTSSVKGEGKSITTINLSKTMAAAGKKVILLDCDFRMSTLANKMKIASTPGITNMLTQLDTLAIRHLSEGFDFIPAGDLPPNPSELLGSEEMTNLLQKLEPHYDYIFIDTPPVGAVTDPLVLVPKVSGVIVIVRENVAHKPVLSKTMDALKMSNAKIIGFMYNGKSMTRNRMKKYYGYGYYSYEEQSSKKKDNKGKEHNSKEKKA